MKKYLLKLAFLTFSTASLTAISATFSPILCTSQVTDAHPPHYTSDADVIKACSM